jgi:uncharacterized membrane protein YhaH (DUF805 family)
MMKYFVGIIILLVYYGIIINKVDAGRCFRYEYIIKSLVIIVIETICFALFVMNVWPILKFLCFILVIVLMFFSLKFTIQRFYDLNLSGWYILLKIIPIFSIFVTLYLYFKKGTPGINDYDKAINYEKLFKNKHCIDIYKDRFIIDNEVYQYELYMGKYSIKISKYGTNNFFKEYLLTNYQNKEDNIYKVIEFPKDELNKIINILGLIIVYDSFYLHMNKFKMFIRKENFKYTIILEKWNNEVSKELFDFFDFPGSFFEDEEYVYYNRIDKEELAMWVKNVA